MLTRRLHNRQFLSMTIHEKPTHILSSFDLEWLSETERWENTHWYWCNKHACKWHTHMHHNISIACTYGQDLSEMCILSSIQENMLFCWFELFAMMGNMSVSIQTCCCILACCYMYHRICICDISNNIIIGLEVSLMNACGTFVSTKTFCNLTSEMSPLLFPATCRIWLLKHVVACSHAWSRMFSACWPALSYDCGLAGTSEMCLQIEIRTIPWVAMNTQDYDGCHGVCLRLLMRQVDRKTAGVVWIRNWAPISGNC